MTAPNECLHLPAASAGREFVAHNTGDGTMTLYEYAPLDSSRDEIRIVQFPKPSTSGETALQCTLQHVLLIAFKHAYKNIIRYFQSEEVASTPILRERASILRYRDNATHDWERDGVKPIEIDAWRYRAEYKHPSEDLINGHVTIPSRFDWGDFEAISYCWDSNIRDKDFPVDWKVIRITSNLETLLQELQQLPEALSDMGFWVYGLYINQEDMMEKDSQVRLMSSIYSQAMSTVVWLGLPTSSSNTAIDKILEVFGDDSINYPFKNSNENYRTLPAGKFESFLVRYWLPIMIICSRPYFGGIWPCSCVTTRDPRGPLYRERAYLLKQMRKPLRVPFARIRSRRTTFEVGTASSRGVALTDFFAGVNGPDPLPKYTANRFDPVTMSGNSPHIDNLTCAAAALQHRRLCISQAGILCLAPDEVKFGDTVAILLGCNYPVLLRPFEDGYKYVGECYVDVIMNGEAVEAADRGECEIEDVVLLKAKAIAVLCQ